MKVFTQTVPARTPRETVRHVSKSRLQTEAAAAEHDLRAGRAGAFDVAFDLFKVDRGDHGAHLRIRVKRITNRHGGGPRACRRKEITGDRFMEDDAAAGIAAFAGIEISAEYHSIERSIEIGVREYDLRVFATELHRDLLQTRGGGRHRRFADTSRAGEGDHVNPRIGRKRRADVGSLTDENIDHTPRQADFKKEPAEIEARAVERDRNIHGSTQRLENVGARFSRKLATPSFRSSV